MSKLKLKNINKVYPNGVHAVCNFDVEIADKEFIVLVGPSGCGKSTVLRMISGLENISRGEFWIDDLVVNLISPADRDISMVFQSYALYPHMTVYDNVAFSLKLRKYDKFTISDKVNGAAKKLGLSHLLSRKPKELSGGQRQRVALARSIVRKPKIFLMDEPLSNLDAALRQEMRIMIKNLHRDLKTNIIYVTHDQIEAMTMADRIIVMNDGFVQQVGKPDEIF
ncbi:ABC-type transport system, ATPase component [Spiroplasma clarkii]|nr:ATP-binding cassette domain-containing protein [Spiroplasma clarkii]ARU91028.1 ABC-type transport system, ATPase component [Spiroplasma clarkii]